MALCARDCNGWPRRWASGQRRDGDPGRTCRIRSFGQQAERSKTPNVVSCNDLRTPLSLALAVGPAPGVRKLTLLRIRQVLPGSPSCRCPEAHRRGQPLHSEALNAKNAPESTICGAFRKRSTTTGSVPWLVPISFPRSAPPGPAGPIYSLTPCSKANARTMLWLTRLQWKWI